MSGPSVSVVMCTCDGERYVGEQLRSIVLQSRPPDQLVVLDDASTDGTAQVVRECLEGWPREVTFVTNPRRLGAVASFGQAIAMARGDVIALSDQDDVWEPEKLEVLAARYAADPSLTAAFSDARLVDAGLRPLGSTMWASCGFRRREQAEFALGRGVEVVLRRNVVAGATLSFRSRMRDVVLPMPAHGLHDGWIALLSAALGPVAAIPAPLVRYRIHDRNHVGVSLGLGPALRARRSREQRVEEMLYFLAAADRLRSCGAERWADELDGKLAHLSVRAALPSRAAARAPVVARSLVAGRYHRYSRGLRSVLHDMVRVGQGKG